MTRFETSRKNGFDLQAWLRYSKVDDRTSVTRSVRVHIRKQQDVLVMEVDDDANLRWCHRCAQRVCAVCNVDIATHQMRCHPMCDECAILHVQTRVGDGSHNPLQCWCGSGELVTATRLPASIHAALEYAPDTEALSTWEDALVSRVRRSV